MTTLQLVILTLSTAALLWGSASLWYVRRARAQARRLILQTLTVGEFHGYELRGLIAERTGEWIGVGRFYSVIHTLDAEGLLESYEAEPNPYLRGRPRVYYRLTDNGRAALAETIEPPTPEAA